jgi:hypothetical protein
MFYLGREVRPGPGGSAGTGMFGAGRASGLDPAGPRERVAIPLEKKRGGPGARSAETMLNEAAEKHTTGE